MRIFEWDPCKERKNIEKHGIDFETAAQALLDPYAVTILDDRFDYGEDRYQTIGYAAGYGCLLLFVAHTMDEENGDEHIRIISARRADRKDRKRYETRSESL